MNLGLVAFSMLISFIFSTYTALHASSLLEMSDQLDRLDKGELSIRVESAQQCIRARDFSCATQQIASANRVAVSTADRKRVQSLNTELASERLSVQREEDALKALKIAQDQADEREEKRQIAAEKRREKLEQQQIAYEESARQERIERASQESHAMIMASLDKAGRNVSQYINQSQQQVINAQSRASQQQGYTQNRGDEQAQSEYERKKRENQLQQKAIEDNKHIGQSSSTTPTSRSALLITATPPSPSNPTIKAFVGRYTKDIRTACNQRAIAMGRTPTYSHFCRETLGGVASFPVTSGGEESACTAARGRLSEQSRQYFASDHTKYETVQDFGCWCSVVGDPEVMGCMSVALYKIQREPCPVGETCGVAK